ncbi:hypothetical protein G9A89_020738 [Geosiphon pyriformis]|nr:hypothetical protein G9A89_020738 [Geosiphon pyriformis]
MFRAFRLPSRTRLQNQFISSTFFYTGQFSVQGHVFKGAKRYKSKKIKQANGKNNELKLSAPTPSSLNKDLITPQNTPEVNGINIDSTLESNSSVPENTLESKAFQDSETQAQNTDGITVIEEETSTPKDYKWVAKLFIAVVLLSSGVYGVGVYKSIHDEKFRDKFEKNLPGANKIVEYVDNLNRQGTFHKIKERTTELSGNVTDFGINIYTNLSAKVSELSRLLQKKVKGESPAEIPQASEAPVSSNEQVLFSQDKKDDEIDKTSSDIAQNIDKEIEKAFTFSPNEPILNKLHETINLLSELLTKEGIADKGQSIIIIATEDLEELRNRIEFIKAEAPALIRGALAEQEVTFNAILEDKEKDFTEHISSLKNELGKERQFLIQEFEAYKQKLMEQHEQYLTAELSRQAIRHAEQLKNELVRQAVAMQRRWIWEVNARVEQERGRRLARLDYINSRLKKLERISLDNAEHLDRSIKAHRVWCALNALEDAVNQPHPTPFVNEITALKKLSLTDDLVRVVLSSIDDVVATTGIDSVSDLAARFSIVREEVRRASLAPEDAGLFAHALSLILSKLMFRKHGLVPGDDVEAILARVDYYLKEHDLDNATRQLNQLNGWPKTIAQDWLQAARNHLEVQQAIQVIGIQALISSLAVL